MARRRPARGSGDLPLDRDPSHIEAMFGDIAGRYDLMNRLMTGGLDGRWRRAAAAAARLAAGDEALDACCGTGDLTFTLAESCPACAVTGLDFTPEMLACARQKAEARARSGRPGPREFVQGDLLALPFEEDRFAAVTVGWGVRNVPDVPLAFREMARVTRPGGRVVCLESTQAPDGAGKRLHAIWQGHVVPLMGRVVTGDGDAYSYLPASVAAFPRAEELAAIMAGAGLTNVRYRRFGFGAVALHVGEVPR
ncbi:MAG TPA: ubiquinone/menaquinone biosynthesis methyltransferase [Thermoleophilia bacterium]|nr:ubiquinone/menaquinone biosynthesis methyltransferase [Thermoleophilia bacterium]